MRETLEYNKIYEYRMSDGDYENLKKIYIASPRNINQQLKNQFIEQTKIRKLEQEFIEINKDETFGSFYTTNKNDIKLYTYRSKETLRKDAPIVLEYFDRYRVSKNQETHEGKFLTEWKIVGAYDQYNLGKELYDNIKEKFKDNIKKDFPTRDTVKERINTTVGIKYLAFCSKKSLDIATTVFGLSFVKSAGLNFAYFDCFIDDIFTRIISKSIEYIENSLENALINEKIPYEEGILYINLEETGSRFMILEKDGNYVITIGNSQELSNVKLKENLAPVFFQLYIKLESFLNEKKGANVTITGSGEAGYLAILLGNALNIPFVVFSTQLEKPIKKFELSDFKNLSESIGFLATSEVLYSSLWEVGLTGVGIIVSLASSLSVPFVSLLLGCVIAIKNITARIVNYKGNEKSIENLRKTKLLDKNYVSKEIPDKLSLAQLTRNLDKEVSIEAYLQIMYYIEKMGYMPHSLGNNNEVLLTNGIDFIKIIPKDENSVKANQNQINFPEINQNNIPYDVKILKRSIKEYDDDQSINLLEDLYKEECWKNLLSDESFVGIRLAELLRINYKINRNSDYAIYDLIESKEIIDENKSKIYYMKDQKYIKEEEKPIDEYLYFMFLDKNTGKLKPVLRKEYVKSLIRSVCDDSCLRKFEDWNCYTEAEGSQKSYTLLTKEMYKEKIIKKLGEKSSENNRFPFIGMATELFKEESDTYLTLKEETSNNFVFTTGVVDSDGNYLEDEIGFIYNNDSIASKELNVKLRRETQKEKNEPKEPTASPVTDGVLLKCNCGDIQTPLIVDSQSHFWLEDNLLATEDDYRVGVNISSFGNCSNSNGKSCSPNILKKWENVSKAIFANEAAALLDCSILHCTKGGKITPTSKIDYWKTN